MKDKIKEYFPFVTWTMIAGGIWWLAQDQTNDSYRQFSTPEMKVKTETHVVNTDPIVILKANINDSLEKMKEDEHRRFQDSIDRVRDTLTKRNAVTIYQMKSKQDTLESLLKKYINIHDN